ncbi:MAG: T9SS type A sorting domain-containing protein, partial [Spirochaetia bacterium]|nr:T9SS type A sorting domain-containing protein [Spirochaetia bacterium]
TYDVALTSKPSDTVVVTLTSADTTNGVTLDKASLTFTSSNWNIGQTVTVTAVDDAVIDAIGTVAIGHDIDTVLTLDANYDALVGSLAGVTANVTDNDSAGVSIVESGGSTDVLEAGATSDTYDVALTSKPSDTVVVTLTSADTTNGVTLDKASLTFTSSNWNVGQTVTVTAVDDAVIDAIGTVAIGHDIDTVLTLDGDYDAIVGTLASVTANVTDNDAAAVTITELGGTTDVTEAGATDTYTAVLTAKPLSDVTLSIAFDTAQVTINGSSTSPQTLTFTSANWSAAQTVTVAAVDEPLIETDTHSSTLTHTSTSSDGNFAGLTINTVIANITDNDSASVEFTSANQASVNETGTLTITAQLSGVSTLDVTIPFTIDAGSTAINPDDYTITLSPITIPAGSTTADITVTITGDAINEGNETVIVNMGTPLNASASGITIHTATITDDDAIPSVEFVTGSQSSIDETGTMTITAQLGAVSGLDVTIPFAIDAGSTAINPDDYTITLSPITIPAGSTTADITVTITGDAINEGNETVIVNMGVPVNASTAAVTSHTATITDDDAPPIVEFTTAAQSSLDETGTMILTAQLSAVSGLDVTIPFAIDVSSTAINSDDYTITASPVVIPAGSTTVDITIIIAGDTLNESNEIVIVNMGTPVNASTGAVTSHTATITDDDAQPTVEFTLAAQSSIDETGTLAITAQLSAASAFDVTIPFTIDASSTAINPADYTITTSPIVIPAGSINADITITIAGDTLNEGDETVIINMGTPVNASAGAVTSHTATITDDDAQPTVDFTLAAQSSFDETGTMTITAQLSAASALDVTIPFAIDASSTAINPDDYTITASPIVIPAGSLTADITITIVNDFIDEANETVIVNMGTPANAISGAVATHTVTITDDDVPVNVIFNPLNVNVTEAGASAVYNVSLDTQPVGNVVINIASSDTTNGVIVDKSSITFTSANWTAQTITITAVDDIIVEGSHSAVINHIIDTTNTVDMAYKALAGTLNSVTVNITDNDDTIEKFVVITAPLSEIEIGATFNVTVQAQNINGEPIVINEAVTIEMFDTNDIKASGVLTGDVNVTFQNTSEVVLNLQWDTIGEYYVKVTGDASSKTTIQADSIVITFFEPGPYDHVVIPPNTAKVSDNYLDFRKNSQSVIGFNITQNSSVNIEIYDMKGRRIKKLKSGNFSKGNNFVEWNVKNERIRSGLYYIYIKADIWKKPQIKKIIIVR